MKSRIAAERLRDLQSVTDAALAYLPLEGLLNELLVRVVEILGVDTSAMLLLEDDGRTLVARAAKGLEEEVERGVRIPVGRGFAGRIAATREPVRIVNVEHAEILNPILREKGIKSLLGVPLVVEGGVIGVLHVGSLTQRAFDHEDVELLQRAADRAALAINSRITERERALADALQRSLIPRLPVLPAVSLAGRYLPAASARVGGDWYDAFQLGDGTLALAIGDVVGHGFHAAAIMGQLRSGLRAFALDGQPPAEVLGGMNRLLRQLEPGRTATVTYLVLDPHGGRVTVAAAGHPPPLLMESGREPRFVELPGSVPLGAVRHASYEQQELEVEPGFALVLYTDGLVERAGESLDDGLARLKEATTRREDDLEHLGDRLVYELLPGGPATDDAALLIAAALPLGEEFLAEFPANVESIPLMRRMLGRWLLDAGATSADVEDLTLAAAEAVANSIEHAYGIGAGVVEVRGSSGEQGVTVAIRDFGDWRPPRGRNRGRGLLLMEGLTDGVEVTHHDNGTTVELSRRIGAEAA